MGGHDHRHAVSSQHHNAVKDNAMAVAATIKICDTCGNAYKVKRVFRRRQDADSFVEWVKHQSGECPGCYSDRIRKAADAANTANSAKSKEVSTQQGWAELVGSEKQVLWAETIRHDTARRLAFNTPAGTPYRSVVPSTEDEYEAVLSDMLRFLRGQSDAKYYISHRRDTLLQWLDNIASWIDAQ